MSDGLKQRAIALGGAVLLAVPLVLLGAPRWATLAAVLVAGIALAGLRTRLD